MDNSILKVIAAAGEKIAGLESTVSLRDYQIGELQKELETCKEQLKAYKEAKDV